MLASLAPSLPPLMPDKLYLPKTWFSYVLICAVFVHFALAHGEADWVLCFGADGHIAVEQAAHTHDQPVSKPAQTTNLTTADLPCQDFPVVNSGHDNHIPLSLLSKTAHADPIFVLLVLALLIIPRRRVIKLCHGLLPLLFTDTRLLSLRSIVLQN